jgi:hypothetical protein
MRRLGASLGLTAACLFSLLTAAHAGIQWLHVHIDEAGSDAKQVRVNVPLSMIEALTPEIRKHVPRDRKLGVGDCELTTAEFRDAVQTLAKARVGHVVQKRENGHRLILKRSGRDLHVEGYEERRGSLRVTARMPWSVAQALAAGEGDELDYTRALKELAAEPQGVIAVTDTDGTNVRIWVDQTAFAETDA